MRRQSSRSRVPVAFALMGVVAVILFVVCLIFGSVEIPLREVINALTGDQVSKESWRIIVTQARVPMAVTALLAGAALSVAGLLLQTCFDNPLAGPSILGVSTGSSLGVAIVMLAFGGSIASGWSGYAGVLAGALLGAGVILLVILAFSYVIHSTAMLLIVGIMVGYLASSAISLLNFFSTQEGVHSYVIWGLGNFSGVSPDRMAGFAVPLFLALILSALLVKPLNALLLGARYAANLGVNIRATRNNLLILSGVLTAIVTAYCGPIGFIGLVVPHIARLLTRTSNHAVLLPATMLAGGATGLLCVAISVLPGSMGMIPVNAITPVIGVPVIIYILLNRKKLLYFN